MMMTEGEDWVLLAYRLPRVPSTPRSAVWRKLRRLGAAQLGDGLIPGRTGVTPVPTVIFVCQHGAAKSVIAAWHLERLADSQGVAVQAVARGTEPEPVILAAAASGLRAEGFDVDGYRPQAVCRPDLVGADRIVSFGPDLTHMAPAGARIEYWTGIPAVSEDFAAARDAIVPRVAALLASMHDRQGSKSCPDPATSGQPVRS